MWSTKTTCPLRLLNFLCCLCSSSDQRLNHSWQKLWTLKGTLSADKLTFQLKKYLISWQADLLAEKEPYQLTSWLSAEKVPYQLTSWLFSWKGTFINWQTDNPSEKVPYQLTSWLFSWKGTLSADMLVQLKRYFYQLTSWLSTEKVSYQLTSW